MEAVRQPGIRGLALSRTDLVWAATAILLVLGLALRARGYLWKTIPFWQDESSWAIRLMKWRLFADTIRPPGFMAVSKGLAVTFSPSETVLRALPWLGGACALLTAPAVAKRLFTSSGARLLFVAVIALHPGAIDLAKEFKPYSVSMALHLGCLLLGLRYMSSGKAGDLAASLGLLLVAALFSHDALFAYPGLFGLLLFEAWRARRRRHALAIGLVALATVALLLGLYGRIWSRAASDGGATSDYWGRKYDVFYVPADAMDTSRLGWTSSKLGELAALPGMRRESWRGKNVSASSLADLKQLDVDVWQTLGLLGCAMLCYRRRWRELLLLVMPLGVLLCFNRLGYWPLGAFRTNLFLLVYAAGLAAAAIDRREGPARAQDLLPAGLLVLVPFLLLGRTAHARKVSSMSAGSAFPEALQALAAMRYDTSTAGPRALLALDSASCASWRYYTQYHPDKAATAKLVERFRANCSKGPQGMARMLRRALRSPKSRAYMLLSSGSSLDEVEASLPSDLTVDAHASVGKRDQLVLRVKKRRSRR